MRNAGGDDRRQRGLGRAPFTHNSTPPGLVAVSVFVRIFLLQKPYTESDSGETLRLSRRRQDHHSLGSRCRGNRHNLLQGSGRNDAIARIGDDREPNGRPFIRHVSFACAPCARLRCCSAAIIAKAQEFSGSRRPKPGRGISTTDVANVYERAAEPPRSCLPDTRNKPSRHVVRRHR